MWTFTLNYVVDFVAYSIFICFHIFAYTATEIIYAVEIGSWIFKLLLKMCIMQYSSVKYGIVQYYVCAVFQFFYFCVSIYYTLTHCFTSLYSNVAIRVTLVMVLSCNDTREHQSMNVLHCILSGANAVKWPGLYTPLIGHYPHIVS